MPTEVDYHETLINNVMRCAKYLVFNSPCTVSIQPTTSLCFAMQQAQILKDKSGVGIIVDYSRDYTVVNGV